MKKRHLVYFLCLVAISIGIAIYTGRFTPQRMLKACFTWGCWIWIYFTFVPLAAARGRSTSAWFWLGALVFWATFTVTLVTGALTVHWLRAPLLNLSIGSAQALGVVVIAAIILSFFSSRRLARHLRLLSPYEQSANQIASNAATRRD